MPCKAVDPGGAPLRTLPLGHLWVYGRSVVGPSVNGPIQSRLRSYPGSDRTPSLAGSNRLRSPPRGRRGPKWTSHMTRIAIVVGSTRPGRKADAVASWVHEIAKHRTDAEFEIVDVADFHLPLLDEALPPSMGRYGNPHTKAWAAKIASFDGFVFVTPEYNHSTSASLKNALDFIYAEWNNKAAGFVGYGSSGGVRAVEHLRGIAGELQIATVRAQVILSLMTDFENYTKFAPDPSKVASVERMLAQVVSWSKALEGVRQNPPPP